MPTLMEAMPSALRPLQRWVCASAGSKRPMRCWEPAAASVSRPGDWGDFDEAREAVEAGIYEWAGFVFADDGIVGIDIDGDAAFGEDGLPSDDALEAIRACASYAEVSKSGRGFHILCRGSLPFKGRANGRGWEIYRDGRYFLLTGRTVAYTEVADAQAGIDLVLDRHFADAPLRGDGGGRRERIWRPSWSVDPATGRAEASWPPVWAGGRHLALVSYCGSLHSAGAAPETVLACALAANERWMRPPLDAGEVAQVAASVTRYRR